MSKRAPDIRKIARRQRWLIWLVLLAIVAQFLPFFHGGRFGMVVVMAAVLIQVAVHFLLIIGVILLVTAQGTYVAITVVCAILMLAPCGNLVVLLLVNMSATRMLRRAGLHVRLLGVDPEEVERTLNPELCTGCGYNLTGNVSGLCPECGRPVDSPGAFGRAGGPPQSGA